MMKPENKDILVSLLFTVGFIAVMMLVSFAGVHLVH